MINEFKYGQTRKTGPSPLSLSLYSTFKKKRGQEWTLNSDMNGSKSILNYIVINKKCRN